MRTRKRLNLETVSWQRDGESRTIAGCVIVNTNTMLPWLQQPYINTSSTLVASVIAKDFDLF